MRRRATSRLLLELDVGQRLPWAFRENGISEKVLPSLTAEDLKELDVDALGHRRSDNRMVRDAYQHYLCPAVSVLAELKVPANRVGGRRCHRERVRDPIARHRQDVRFGVI